MFNLIFGFFNSPSTAQHHRKKRQPSLPNSFFPTNNDIQPLSPLTITDPISVPLSYQNSQDSANGSSLDSTDSSLGPPTPPSQHPHVSSSLWSILSEGNEDEFIMPCEKRRTNHHHALVIKKAAPIISATPVEAIITTSKNSSSRVEDPTEFSETKQPEKEEASFIPHDDVLCMDKNDFGSTTSLFQYHQGRRYYAIRSLRENPDHLRMVVAEINMMRVNKLVSPLRPRAILLERSDPFIPCQPSPLKCCL
ncbi:uncharacterized protein BX664DRAFT_323424 [Halteromyces radiatus]|uniref:uncharacterized protein n=1 Tax=Halteromyces radiatus TaxID=101107 RepID=UPI00221F720D|nr:uncharacterized protein BX664DRAFT_323424 [Halteromyces radiatus]KAI8096229.1 hypothetical protein BX664DRAFT_323424 [Halteromyces radiatus]